MTYVLGIDPGAGSHIGVVGFDTNDLADTLTVLQCNWRAFDNLLPALVADGVIAVERFIPSKLGQRGNAPSARRITLAVIQRCEHYAQSFNLRLYLRSAAEVKPWASDQRLLTAGLLVACKGLPHARDGARHALFAAVHDCAMHDPLSTRAGARGV